MNKSLNYKLTLAHINLLDINSPASQIDGICGTHASTERSQGLVCGPRELANSSRLKKDYNLCERLSTVLFCRPSLS